MTDGESKYANAETRCIALSESDREGSVDVYGKRFPTRVDPET